MGRKRRKLILSKQVSEGKKIFFQSEWKRRKMKMNEEIFAFEEEKEIQLQAYTHTHTSTYKHFKIKWK
jgi:hypothetical protein